MNNSLSAKIFYYLERPIYQCLIFLFLTPLAVFILSPDNAEEAWLIAGYPYYGFLLINLVFLWFTKNGWQYFFYSVCCSVAFILVIAVLMPNVIKWMDLIGSQESAMVFLIFMYHPAALLVILFARMIHHSIYFKKN